MICRTRRVEVWETCKERKEKDQSALDAVKEEIEALEEQVNSLLLDNDSGKRPSGKRFWAMMGHRYITFADSNKIKATLDEARNYKQQLNRMLGYDDRGKSTLELERQRIREA